MDITEMLNAMAGDLDDLANSVADHNDIIHALAELHRAIAIEITDSGE